MKYRSLLRVMALPMVLVFVMFYVVPVEAWERGGGGRGRGFSREGRARDGGFSSGREGSGARSRENWQSERGGGRQEEGGSRDGEQRSRSNEGERSSSNERQQATSNEGQRGTSTQNQAQRQQAMQNAPTPTACSTSQPDKAIRLCSRR